MQIINWKSKFSEFVCTVLFRSLFWPNIQVRLALLSFKFPLKRSWLSVYGCYTTIVWRMKMSYWAGLTSFYPTPHMYGGGEFLNMPDKFPRNRPLCSTRAALPLIQNSFTIWLQSYVFTKQHLKRQILKSNGLGKIYH